ncbi:hypothetical protein Hdeb2414_s0014g00432031 [Helianthus debilis subsp. tardiflorus]|nr:hypothetical protein HanIR_Chr03g0101401 [Helianthus annuus]KAJ0942219.1 hypothetical protein HanPSC8_Chr03g0089381 [Helianthus annuus]
MAWNLPPWIFSVSHQHALESLMFHRMLVLWFYLRCWSLGVNISTEWTRTGPKPKKVESTDSGHSAYGFIFGISHHWSLQFGYGLKTMTN